ncbi:MAG TPA: SDR family oxidoreductase [Polyangiales bacterium]|jgi:NAD(P)-dependent dehydrogenase (short-subunit alcohol dehydrogenase family)|nr:SDR family oxidoreductase [Polyangiales bacterium]
MSNEATFDFSGAKVLVTGGSNGIGRAIAKAFAVAGAEVAITGTRASASEYDDDLSSYDYHPLQLTDKAGIESLAASLDRLDILVNNAGGNFPGGKHEAAPDVFEESVAINLFGAYRLAVGCRDKLAASTLEGGASVINFASMAAFFAVPIVPGYGAGKAATVQMTKNLAASWAAEGIRVNAIAPGLVESNMTKIMKGVEPLEKPFIDRTPLRRWGAPEDIAPVALFLASSSARFITGQTLLVDGGFSIT